MQSLFLAILKTSLIASCVVILILIAKKLLGKRLNIHFHYYIWLLLLFHLIMPFSIESPYSIFNVVKSVPTHENYEAIFEKSQMQPLYQIITEQEQGVLNLYNQPELSTVEPSAVEVPFNQNLLSATQILTVIWLSGFILVSSTMIFSRIAFTIRLHKNKNYANKSILNLFEKRKATMNVKRAIPVILDKRIITPSIYSVLSPKLIMPSNIEDNLTADEIDFIFQHELTHYKKGDLLIFALVNIMRVVHWFNPLLWYAFHKMECDCESSCDADVLRALDYDERQRYGMTIIKVLMSLSPNKIPIVNLGVGKSNSDMKRRILMISKFQRCKVKGKSVSMFIGILAVISVVVLSDPVSETVSAESTKPVESVTDIHDNHSLKNQLPSISTQQSSIDSIFYDEVNSLVVVRKTEKIKSADDVAQVDAYWDKTYTFTVEGISEPKVYQINSPLVKSISISATNGVSTLTVTGNEIFTFSSTEDINNIYFTAKTPKEVFEYIVVVDPGHGGGDPGAKHETTDTGMSIQEKDLTLSLAREIAYIAEHTIDSKLKIYLTRQIDEKIELEDAANLANKLEGVYIGIHYNTSPKNESNGTETYYFETNPEGKKLAELLQIKLVSALQTMDGGNKPLDLYMLKNVAAPAVVIDVAYISNANDLQKILSPDFTENAALSILNGLNEYFGVAGEFSQTHTSFIWPTTSQNKISSIFGERKNPLSGEKEFHTGIDIPIPIGSNVVAVADGKVITVDSDGIQGNLIVIEHNTSLKTLYAHNSDILVREGQYVLSGELVARSGNSGATDGAHLHFEVQKNGTAIDPITFLKQLP